MAPLVKLRRHTGVDQFRLMRVALAILVLDFFSTGSESVDRPAGSVLFPFVLTAEATKAGADSATEVSDEAESICWGSSL